VLDARTALLVVDLQTITLGNARTRAPEELLAEVASLIAAFRARELPVWHAATTGLPRGVTQYSQGARAWTAEQAAIAPEVAPAEGEPVVRRAGWSAFAGTDLAAQLSEADVATVVIVGLATPFGIESTARSAYDLGFSVVVPTDAVAGPDPAAHEWTLTRVIPLLGRTTTAAELISGASDAANHEETS